MAPNQRVFLLSPAKAGGKRYSFLLREQATFDLAIKLRHGSATIGEIYTFISGLYFRGKMAYSAAFHASNLGIPGTLVIVPGLGLITPETLVTLDQLQAIAKVPVSEDNPVHLDALQKSAKLLDQQSNGACSYVLLGSVASGKYTRPLLEVFDDRLLFPAEFVGRGDMSRGGLMLRHALSRTELTYVPVQGATLRGSRPPKLKRLWQH